MPNTNKMIPFSASYKMFKEQTEHVRDVCIWQIFPNNKNFILECWQLHSGHTSIFQIFGGNRGYKTFEEV